MAKVCLLLFLFFPMDLFSQLSIPPAYKIDSDTAGFYLPDRSNWQMLEDTSAGKWTIGQVSSLPVAGFFHKQYKGSEQVSYQVNSYWIRFKLKNNLSRATSIALQQKSAYADFYVAGNDGKWMHKTTGFNKPWTERDGYKLVTAIPVVLKPGEEVTVYEKVVFDYRATRPQPLEAGFVSTEKLVRNSYVENDTFLFKTILGSFLIGLLFFAATFNFFFFLVVRERVYLYYSLCLMAGSVNEYHAIFFHVFFRDHPYLLNTHLVFFLVLVNYFAIQMERHFLHTFTHLTRWDKFLQSTVFIQFLAALTVYFAGPYLANSTDIVLWKVWDWVQGIVLVSILTTFLLFIKKRDKSARQFIIACLPVATVWVANYIILHGANVAIAARWNTYYDRLELLCISSLVIILSWLLFDRYNTLRKENAERALVNERLAKEKEIERSQLIAQQKVVLEEEVAARTAELKQSLAGLKAAQKQLVQKEKMASLGELTAGIAHEIQNPLNFVNNFSEVSVELLEELRHGPLATLQTGYKSEADEVVADLTENLQKIHHHGKRAESIVRAMLQHSSSRSGTKELTDINVLAEKYLQISYSGMAAKDKTFHVKLVTDFDNFIGKLEVVQQDIGRVLLNLYNNAFYAVTEKKKTANIDGPERYEPTILVGTKKINGVVQICVRDNGAGISPEIVDKIFQPFFTTKPAGKGTGLGLSLSYDIIKANEGELTVETKEGEYSEFIVELPII
jgi:two-component system NtrC family sensor kinase